MIALSAWADYVVCYLIYEVHGVWFFYVRIGVFWELYAIILYNQIINIYGPDMGMGVGVGIFYVLVCERLKFMN